MQSGNQDEIPLPVQTGEDTIYIFLDTILGLGYTNGGLLPFGADHMIKITGQNGIIHTAEFFDFDGDTPIDWSWRYIKDVDAGSDVDEIETAIDVVPINSYFHMVDWNSETDKSSHIIGLDGIEPAGIRSFTTSGTTLAVSCPIKPICFPFG